MRNRPLCSVCLVILVLAFVLVLKGGEKFITELRPSPAEQLLKEDDKVKVSGRVYAKEIKSDYQVLYLKNNSITFQNQSLQESKIIIYEDSKIKLKIGNIIEGAGKISFYENAGNPGNFDQKLYYQRQGNHARIWCDSLKITDNRNSAFKNYLAEFRQSWKDKLYGIMGEEKGAVLSAMILGDKNGMDLDLKELYQKNGIGHILAISGLHLSFIGLGIYRILRGMTGSYGAASCGAALFLGLYILMIGFTVSAVRALVMFLFRVGADITGRHYDAPTALAAAAVLVIWWRPLYFYDGGFWLSFGAVLGVILIIPIFKGLPLQGIWASLGVNIAIIPFLLYYFYEFPVYSLLLNLLVIPLMSVLLFLGITGSFFLFLISFIGKLELGGCSIILMIYEWSCQKASVLPGARLVTGQPPVWKMLLYYVCLLIIILAWNYVRNQKKHFRAIIPGIILYLTALIVLVFPPAQRGQLNVAVLDVGQGDGIFMKGPAGKNYFFDGGSSDVKNVGRYRIEPYLKSQGVGKLDYVFISHGDSDHMNGIEEMIDRSKLGIQIHTLVLPQKKVWDEALASIALKAQNAGIQVVVMEQGQTVEENGMTIECLAPANDYNGETGNAASMVLAVNYGEFDMLLTGDVEAEGEEALKHILKEKGKERTWEVLKVAHHGSKNSSGEEILSEISPMYAVISAGKGNRYGHPHKETLERLWETGCSIYSTQQGGAVMMEVKKERLRLYSYRGKQLN